MKYYFLAIFSLALPLNSSILGQSEDKQEHDFAIVGAGIMGATLAAMLGELDPNLDVAIYEKLDRVAGESSDALANAGTGHAGLAELNYTPLLGDGTVDISKAIQVASEFEESKQFWGYLARTGAIERPEGFIHSVPHIAWVKGPDDVAFLKKRYDAMMASPLFAGMVYSERHDELRKWMPLMHTPGAVAATRSDLGTDVNFGRLTELLIRHAQNKGAKLQLQHQIDTLEQTADGRWDIGIYDARSNRHLHVLAKHVFLAAGGATLLLLQKSGIPEADGIAGFPISGQFLVCNNESLAMEFNAKVYGKAKVGAPPMSVPHLDTRIIDGKKLLVFGPFAGFSPQFTKNGSYWDFISSLNLSNLAPLVDVGIHNISLVQYLFGQVMQTHDERMEALREFLPDAVYDEWELFLAAFRVQISKKDKQGLGRLIFGTELIFSKDATVSALMGASPGASTSVPIAVQILEKTYPEKVVGPWRAQLERIIPSYGQNLSDNPALLQQVRAASHRDLKLKGVGTDCGGTFGG